MQRTARSVSTLAKIKQVFDEQTGNADTTRAHALRSDAEDVKKVVNVLMKNRILEPVTGRKLTQFPNFKPNPLVGLNWKQLPEWIDKKKKQLLKLKHAVGEVSLTDCDDSSGDNSADEQ